MALYGAIAVLGKNGSGKWQFSRAQQNGIEQIV
jgi:hypothetical protein